jgi:hypothetical protein
VKDKPCNCRWWPDVGCCISALRPGYYCTGAVPKEIRPEQQGTAETEEGRCACVSGSEFPTAGCPLHDPAEREICPCGRAWDHLKHRTWGCFQSTPDRGGD